MTIHTDDDVPVVVWHLVGIGCHASALVLVTVSALVSDSGDAGLALVVTISSAFLLATTLAMLVLGGFEHRGLLMWWPILACATAGAAGVAAPESTSPLPGILTLSFAYVGLCLPPKRAWWLLPVAAPALIAMLDLDVGMSLLRVPLTAIMWMVVAELPARLLARVAAQRSAFADAARTDALTGLLNRATMHETLDVSEATDAVVLIDLDRFKLYNDTEGHVAGDALLVDFAATLQECCTGVDRVYRYGGEEFLLVLPQHSLAEAEALVAVIESRWAGRASGITFSAGVAEGGLNSLRLADARMYGEKERRGTNRLI